MLYRASQVSFLGFFSGAERIRAARQRVIWTFAMKIETRCMIVQVLALLMASGCSTLYRSRRRIDIAPLHLPTTYWDDARLPASIESDDATNTDNTRQQLESSFQDLLSASDPGVETERYIGQLTEVFYRAQAELNQFDRNLDAGDTLWKNPSYPRLLAWRSLSRQVEEKLTYFYDRLLEVRTGAPADSPGFRAAGEALAGFTRSFRRAAGSDRLALAPLAEELQPVAGHYYRTGLLRDHGPDPDPGLGNCLIQSPDQLKTLVADPGVKAELNAKTQWFGKNESPVNRLISATADDIAAGIHELTGGRDPQSAAFYPDAGPHGNITGYEFPRGTWALTFDDGPLPRYSQIVLANLKEHGIKATVFELAGMARQFPAMSLAYRDYGMTMGNHSFTHPVLPKLSDAGLRHEVADAESALASILGFRPRFFRLPYGAGLHVQRVRQMIADQKMIDVFWTVDSLDWQDHDPVSIADRVRKQMRQYGRGIILFHDIHPQSVAGSKLVMDDLVAGHYRVVTIEEIVNELNGAQVN